MRNPFAAHGREMRRWSNVKDAGSRERFNGVELENFWGKCYDR